MTTVLNLGGGPGCGKSTQAALVYGQMKKLGMSVELVREYIKSWSWEGRPIRDDDEIYIFSKQLRLESPLYGKVDWIITDRPLWLSSVYERFFSKQFIIEPLVDNILRRQKEDGIRHVDMLVERTAPYVKEGRYQTSDEALVIDNICQVIRPNLIKVGDTEQIMNIVLESGQSEAETYYAELSARMSERSPA